MSFKCVFSCHVKHKKCVQTTGNVIRNLAAGTGTGRSHIQWTSGVRTISNWSAMCSWSSWKFNNLPVASKAKHFTHSDHALLFSAGIFFLTAQLTVWLRSFPMHSAVFLFVVLKKCQVSEGHSGLKLYLSLVKCFHISLWSIAVHNSQEAMQYLSVAAVYTPRVERIIHLQKEEVSPVCNYSEK